MNAVDDVHGLLEAAVGDGVFSRDEVDAVIGSDLAHVFVYAAEGEESPELTRVSADADLDASVVGVSIARKFEDAEALSEHPYLHADPDEVAERIDLSADEFPVGSVLVSAIAPAYRGEGRGEEISFAALGHLLERGVTPVLQLEWDRPDSPGVEKLQRAGYEPRARLPDHFPPGWDCGACAPDPCTCDVVAFVL